MIKLAIIGLGDIARYYVKGLRNSKLYEVVAVCDINDNATAKSEYFVPFFKSYTEMTKVAKPDCCLVTVNEQFKYPIIVDLLSMGMNVLTEKPLALTKNQFNSLFSTAKENNAILDIMYHYQYGGEVLFLKDYVKTMGALKTGTILLHESYAYNKNCEIDKNFNHKEAWIDNGINAVSVFDLLVNLNDYNLFYKNDIRTTALDCIATERVFKDNQGNMLKILVDWRTPSNKKYFIFEYEGGIILVDSKELKVYKDGECIYNQSINYPRMYDQYDYYFNNCEIQNNYEKHQRIHRLIYL